MSQKRVLKWVAVPAAASLVLFLSGCATSEAGNPARGYLPDAGDGVAVTNHTNDITGLWTSSWIVLLAVGVISWGLLGYAAIAYRRRKNDVGLPVQLRYNMPIETLFTVVPLILVVGFFAFTAKTMQNIEDPKLNAPEYKVSVIAKQWSWDFGYQNAQNINYSVYDTGIQLPDSAFKAGSDTFNANTKNNMHIAGEPVLYLVKDKPVEIDMRSRDVIHSFWIVDFLYKKDVFPGGSINKIYVTPQREGTYEGKCAELCGEYHSAMLFQVKVVSQAEYDAHIAELRAAGHTGNILSTTFDRNISGDNKPWKN